MIRVRESEEAGESEEAPAARFELESAKAALEKSFGFDSFRPAQVTALEALASGRDCVFIMPTGSGKSLCYQVPALVLPGVTIVVSPLIALMKDQVDGLCVRGVEATFINSTLDPAEQRERIEGMVAGDYRLVYVAPERFRNRSFRAALENVEVSLLAVDEAHCISQWGHDFRPDYRRLREIREILGNVQAVALTATATPEVQSDIADELAMSDPVTLVTGFDRPNLACSVERTSGEDSKLAQLETFLRACVDEFEDDGVPSGIIYAGTRKHAESVAHFANTYLGPALGLKKRGPICRAYHAGLDDNKRHEVQEIFMEGRLPWVVATNAFGMGVDKSDIRFVIHYDLPGSVEAYYQEIGRAGRDGLPSQCMLLFDEKDRYLQEFFIDGANPDRATIESVHRHLWSLGENPIFRTLDEIERMITENSAEKVNGMAVRSAIMILDHARAITRLDHFDRLSNISLVPGRDWLANPYPKNAKAKRNVWESLRETSANADEGDSLSIHLESWAFELSVSEESLKRTLLALTDDAWIRYTPPFRGRAIRLPDEFAPPPLDWPALEERRRREKQRLQRTLAFARSGECRRNYILNYFGETRPDASCGTCDNCQAGTSVLTQEARDLTDDEFTVVRKVLSGVARVRGRCGRNRIIQMLRGSKAQGIQEQRLDQLSTYGLLRTHSKTFIREVIDRLEENDCVAEEGSGRFPKLNITPRGARVLKDEERPQIAYPAATVTARSSSRSTSDGLDLAHDEERVFQELRTLRREIAEELNLPAYRIFNDKTLRQMCRVLPCTRQQMLAVPGVGQHTLELFGDRFLAAINETRS